MAPAKRNRDNSPDWEGAPATKRPKTSQGSEQSADNPENYGTLSSQRPTRTRKRPERFLDLPTQPAPKKAKVSSKKAVATPKPKRSSKKSATTPKRTRQQVAEIESQLPVESTTHDTDGIPPAPEKKSAIVRLKFPPTGNVPTTPPRRSALDHHGVELESVLSSPPASLPMQSPRLDSTYTDASLPQDGQSQCAQGVPPPVPASSQDIGPLDSSQIEPATSHTPTSQSWLLQTPAADSRRKNSESSSCASLQTPHSVSSQDAGGSFTYPTPNSAVYHGPDTVCDKSNVRQLEQGRFPSQESDLTQPTLPLYLVCYNCNGSYHNTHNCTKSKSQEQPDQIEDREGLTTPSTISQPSRESKTSKPFLCDNSNRAGHIALACAAEGSAAEPTAQSSIAEDQCPACDATNRDRHFHGALVASSTRSYASSEATTECEDNVDVSFDDAISSTDDSQLYAIAEQLLAQRNTGLNKPEPRDQPEVWADGRQELCETLHYYRSYQSACYSTGGFVRGFMFDKIAHPRDYIDSNVLISRAGGGLTKDKDSGEMKAGRDQTEDSVSQGLRNCMVHRNPVVITTGVDNPHIPSKPPHQYCVMDYFKPTHIWVEKSGDSKIVRYRFEKLNTKKESWWLPKDGQDPVELGSLPPPVEKTCDTCSVSSVQIYLNRWMCLQPACTAFWKIITSTPGLGRSKSLQEPKEASLTYDPRFLKQKTPWQNDDHEYPLISNTAELSGHSIPGEDTSVAFWSGMVCPHCGRCISRLNWMGWKCPNTNCGYTRTPPHTLISALSLRDPFWPVTNSYTLARDTQFPLIDVKVSFEHGYRINRYNLPGIDGFITHMIANKTVLEEQGGPDAMFEELQQTDIGLQRRSMPNGQLKGPNYCRHFAVNYGMPYKFIAATESHSFEGAARPITSTRSRLNWAAKLLMTQDTGKTMEQISEEWQDKEFNEVLALGYFEEQKINYHDDGEFGLGPTIATLSLGAPGTMRIRMKARQYHGVSSGAGLYDEAPPIPGCQQYDARIALQPALNALKHTDSKAYAARRKQIPKDLGLNCKGNAKDVLTIQLGHGDIVVMHGADVQRYYEHAVEHAGKLRFALTCRYIDPESLKAEYKPTYEVGPDVEGYDGSRLV